MLGFISKIANKFSRLKIPINLENLDLQIEQCHLPTTKNVDSLQREYLDITNVGIGGYGTSSLQVQFIGTKTWS